MLSKRKLPKDEILEEHVLLCYSALNLQDCSINIYRIIQYPKLEGSHKDHQNPTPGALTNFTRHSWLGFFALATKDPCLAKPAFSLNCLTSGVLELPIPVSFGGGA